MGNRLAAEAIGTFWIVFAGCGSALLAGGVPQLGIGVFGIAFAFGLSVVTMVYAVGHISGGHLNPAVSVGLMLSKRFPAQRGPRLHCRPSDRRDPGRWRALSDCQRAGGLRPRRLRLQWIRRALPGRLFAAGGLLRRSGVHRHVHVHHSGVTDSRAPQGFAPLTIGLAVALINWAGIPVTNLSINPARSAAPRSSRTDGRCNNSGSFGSPRSSVPRSPG